MSGTPALALMERVVASGMNIPTVEITHELMGYLAVSVPTKPASSASMD